MLFSIFESFDADRFLSRCPALSDEQKEQRIGSAFITHEEHCTEFTRYVCVLLHGRLNMSLQSGES